MTALVDILSSRLSHMTGSAWHVHRVVHEQWHIARGGQPYRKRVRGYTLSVTRDDHTHHFQGGRPVPRSEMERWLASLCDMISMGFVPCNPRTRS